MFLPLTLTLIALGYTFVWPLVDHWLRRDEDAPSSSLEIGLVTLVFSTGALSLILFYGGLLPGRWITPWLALVAVLGLFGLGLALNRRWFAPGKWKVYWLAQWRRLARLDLESLLLWTILAALSIMLIHALYYPFIGDDTLSRYGLQARQIFLAGRIPAQGRGYPPLEPLIFVATWFAAGGVNEHLAKLYPVLTSAGTLGATFLVGRQMGDRSTGLLAAALVALTPAFIRFGTLGYTDIPSTFPLTLAVVYILRGWDTGRLRDQVLASVLIGIGLFTKQSALTWLASAAVVPVVRAVATRSWRRIGGELAALTIPAVLIAGPWYLRNAILTHGNEILPVAGLYHLEEQGTALIGLLPSLGWPGDFGPALRVLYAAGWIAGIALAARQGWSVLRGRLAQTPADLLLAAMVIPYWLAWWINFSYDGRFLLFVMPLMAIWSARVVVWVAAQIASRVRLPRLIWQSGAGLLLAGTLVWGASDRLGGVYYAVTQPLTPEYERLRRAKGSMIDVATYIRQNLDPVMDRIVLVDGRLEYYLLDFNVDSFYPLTLAGLQGYDYLVHSAFMHGIYTARLGWDESEFIQHYQDGLVFQPVYASSDAYLVRILRTSTPTAEEIRAWQTYRAEHRYDKNTERP